VKAVKHPASAGIKFHVLTEVCSFINSAMPPDQQLVAIVDAANTLLGIENSSVILMDAQAQLLYFHVATGAKSQEIKKLNLQPGEGIAGWVIDHDSPLVVPDVAKDSRFSPRISELIHFDTKSILCVPIHSRSKVIGAFEAVNRLDGKPFKENDVPLLTAFVSLIGIVLENSLYRQTIEQANRDLENIVQAKTNEIEMANKTLTVKTQRLALTTKIISLINSNQTMIEIFVGVVEHLRKLVPFDYITVALLQGSQKTVTLLELYPQAPHTMADGIKTPFDDPVVRYVVSYKRALSHNRPRWYHCFLEGGRFLEKQLGAMFCTPILTSENVWGTLNLGNLDTFQYHQEVVDVMTFIAKQIGVAFEREKMRHTLEDMNQELNDKTVELRKNIISIGDANLKLFETQQQLRGKDRAMKKLLAEVQQKNEELQQTLEELKQTQTQLVQSEKMASLGQLVAGIAHELNTPSGAIKAASEMIPEYVQKIFTTYDKLYATNLSSEHRQLVHDMVGAMIATAKELTRRSTAEIRDQSKTLAQRLREHGLKNYRLLAKDIARCDLEDKLAALLELFDHYGSDLVMEFLNTCNHVIVSARDNQLSIETITRIVRALKSYSYLDQSQERRVDLNEDLENTITILHSQIPANIQIIRKFGVLPKIVCLGSELNQVWTNMLQNAIQALEHQEGTITIATESETRQVTVKITDTGPGIPAEIQEKIFDPFFTTRRGKARGLGLSIAHQIITRHHGAIRVSSVPGNTCFEVVLPTA
jgi:signal transduction histidine kinase